jgi:hypothetical protein
LSPAFALLLLTPLQAPNPSPPRIGASSPELPPVDIEEVYGPVQIEDLEQVASNGASYHRRLVQTRGVVADLVPGRYLQLQQGTARVMLIPPDGAYADHASMLGMDVDVTGVARVLPAHQGSVPCRGVTVPESKCEDWDLPTLPDAQPQWPPVSISVTRMVDRGTDRGSDRGPGTRGPDVGGVVGQFRGANLCRDLPVETRRDPADWVLLASDGPLWVTGRRPEGKGFRLDPAHRGDTSRWLAVTGKVQVVGATRYLKASKVQLVARPEGEPAPCPP